MIEDLPRTSNNPMLENTGGTRFVPKNNSFDFLRLVLAVFVIAAHSYALSGLGFDPVSEVTHGQENPGGIAVAGFFIISGYLITQSYQNAPAVWRFLWHRFLRIYPAFWVCLVVTVVAIAPFMYFLTFNTVSAYLPQCGASALDYLRANFAIKIGQHDICGLLAGNPLPSAVNGSLWTLYDEVRCYLAIAAIGVLGGLGRRKWVFTLSALVLFVAYALKLTFPQLDALPVVGGGLLRNSVFFFSGGMFSLYADRIPVRTSIFVACLILGIASALTKGTYAIVSIVTLPYVTLWLATKLPCRGWAKRGDYSYGLYIFAFPVQQILALLNVQQKGVAAFFLASVAFTFVFAFLSCHLVERPALRLKRIYPTRPPRGKQEELAAKPITVGVMPPASSKRHMPRRWLDRVESWFSPQTDKDTKNTDI